VVGQPAGRLAGVKRLLGGQSAIVEGSGPAWSRARLAGPKGPASGRRPPCRWSQGQSQTRFVSDRGCPRKNLGPESPFEAAAK